MAAERSGRLRRCVALLLAAVTVLATACGAGARDGSPVTVEAISASTSSAGSARMSMTMTMTLPQLGEVRTEMEGLTTLHSDVEQIRADLSMTMESAPIVGTVEGSLRLVEGRMFVKGSFAQTIGLSGATDAWVEVEGEQRDALMQLGVAGPDVTDPTMALDMLRAVEGLEPAGREVIRGVDTRRLSAVTTMGALLDAQEVEWEDAVQDQQELTGQAPDQSSAGLLETVRGLPIELDVWIDDQDRLRRNRLRVDMAPMWQELLPAGDRPEAGEATMVADVEFYDYGIPVDVEIPDTSPATTSPSSATRPADAPTAGMAAATAEGTVTVDGGPLEGSHATRGSCVTSGGAQGIDLGVSVTFVHGGDGATSMHVRVPFANGGDLSGQLLAAIPDADGQPQTVDGTVTATVDIGPVAERSVREYVEVTFDGALDGHRISGEITCRPGS